MLDWTDPGRLTSTISVPRFVGAAGKGGVAGAAPRHVPNAAFASSRARARDMSPATTRRAPHGRRPRGANDTVVVRGIPLYGARRDIVTVGLVAHLSRAEIEAR